MKHVFQAVEIGAPGTLDTTGDRLGFTLFVASVLHVGLILGVGFSKETPGPRSRSLDIILARIEHQNRVDKADYLAQMNQLGSGDKRRRDETTPNEPGRDGPAPGPQRPKTTEQALERTATLAPQQRVRDGPEPLTENRRPTETEVAAVEQTQDPSHAANELTSLMAKLDAQQRAYSERPRVMRLTAASARAADDAEYLFNWKHRIETIGNLNYPLEARRRRLYGDLRLLVAVTADGSVKEVRILQSSGERILDEAALRIVRLAEPFDPFPESVRARTDIIEIIRTWQFRQEGFSANR